MLQLLRLITSTTKMTQFIPKSNKDLEHVVALRSTLLMIVAQLLTISSKLFKNGDCQDNELE